MYRPWLVLFSYQLDTLDCKTIGVLYLSLNVYLCLLSGIEVWFNESGSRVQPRAMSNDSREMSAIAFMLITVHEAFECRLLQKCCE